MLIEQVPIKYGDPRLPSRYWAEVQRSKGGCWHWTGRIDRGGYARTSTTSNRNDLAYRVAYEALIAPVPRRGEAGHQQLDHECHNRSRCKGGPTCRHRRCVNPNHLTLKPQRANMVASPNSPAQRTHCPQGHSLADAYLRPNGHRMCRPCAKARAARNKAARVAARGGPVRPGQHQLDKTACPEGHPYAGDNLYVSPSGHRRCRRCAANRDTLRKGGTHD